MSEEEAALVGGGSSSSSSSACGGCADSVPKMPCEGGEGMRGRDTTGGARGRVSGREGCSGGGGGGKEGGATGSTSAGLGGSGAARWLGLDGCWGRVLCIAGRKKTKTRLLEFSSHHQGAEESVGH